MMRTFEIEIANANANVNGNGCKPWHCEITNGWKYKMQIFVSLHHSKHLKCIVFLSDFQLRFTIHNLQFASTQTRLWAHTARLKFVKNWISFLKYVNGSTFISLCFSAPRFDLTDGFDGGRWWRLLNCLMLKFYECKTYNSLVVSSSGRWWWDKHDQ